MAYENKYMLLEDSQGNAFYPNDQQFNQLHYLNETSDNEISRQPIKSFDSKEEAFFNGLHDKQAAQQLHVFCQFNAWRDIYE